VASAGFRDRKLGVEIYFSHRLAKLAFDHFEGERQDIEAEFGGALDWQRMDERRACRIAIYRTDFDPANQEQRPKQHEWYLKQLNSFVSVFRGRIDALDIDALEQQSPRDELPASQ
jgi:hypothetical protein